MRKKLLPCMAALSCLAFTVQAAPVWDGTADTEWLGEGTEASPYLISTAEELAGLAQRCNKDDETFEGKHFRLTSDIWLSDEDTPAEERINWVPIASHDITNDDSETNPGGWYGTDHFFHGTFDGAGHTIHNLWFNGSTNFDDFNDPFGSGQIDFTAYNKALFGGLKGAVIKNLNVKDVNVTGAIVAGLAMEAFDTSFTDVYIDGHVKAGDLKNGGTAAGLVQNAYSCDFLRCESNVEVYGKSNTASFVSLLRANSSVTDCKAGGSATGCVYASGFISYSGPWEEGNDMRVPVIRNCSSSGLVTVIPGRNQGNDGGGFIGLNLGEIYNCFSTSDLHVTVDVGAGFCVENRGHIESCYALGNLYNEEYGVSLSAFVSDNGLDAGWSEYYPGTVLNCYATGSLTAPDAPTDVIATPTRIWGFSSWNNETAGSVMANCYYDSTKNPKLVNDYPTIGSFGVSTEYMRSKEFVDDLNAMAGVMGTTLWEFNPDGYPTCTDVKATDVTMLFAGGDGTEANPFLVSNKKELENLAYATNRNWPFRGQHILQTADIALNGPFETWGEEMPTQWTPIAYCFADGRGGSYHFCGTYDGGMHTVANLYIDDKDKMYCGLFGMLGGGAEIKNLGVVDAWMQCGSYSGIIVGAARFHNEADQFAGASSISHCWTTGQIIPADSYWGFRPGGIIGYVPYNGDFILDACWSTAKAEHGLIGDGVYDETFINGCWFAGKGTLYPSNNYFWTFIDETVNPGIVNEPTLAPMGLTTEYMQGKQFVNDLNYAAAYKGFEGGWRWNENAYPSFTSGEEASLTITLQDGVNDPLTFKVLPGSTVSRPEVPEKEGEVCLGWYTDEQLTKVFQFGDTPVTENTVLYARWANQVTPDVSIFKNKFTDTYTIKTIEQLYGFASIVNGESTEVEKSDFTGKTVKLGTDLVLNDTEDFDSWGTDVAPVEFPCIGISGYADYVFNGTFDGQGYSISGMYITKNGMFSTLGKDGVVKGLLLKNACLYTEESISGGLLVGSSRGKILQCGVEGKIIDKAQNGSTIGGIVCRMGEYYYDNSSVELKECYAVVDIETCKGTVGALFYSTEDGTSISDNFVRGSVKIGEVVSYGAMNGIGSNTTSSCYGAVDVTWNKKASNFWSVGGAYASGESKSALYYDRSLVSKAFDTLETYQTEQAYAKGTGLPTGKMKLMASYEDFDFENVWGRRDDINDGYPYLRWTAPGLENDPDVEFVPVESITFAQETVTLKEGEETTLSVEVLPADATQTLEWSSSDPAVATVADGKVTAVSKGTAEITAKATDGSGVKATCTVIVEKSTTGLDSVMIGSDSEVTILSLQGHVMYKGRLADFDLQPGLYIVRNADGATVKVRFK